MEDIKQKIIDENNFKGEILDKKGAYIGYYQHYSITLQLMTSEVEDLKKVFPLYRFHNLYSNYYLIGFNKK